MIHVTVSIRIRDDADPYAVVEDMDYGFTHDAILDTEIRDVTCPEDRDDLP